MCWPGDLVEQMLHTVSQSQEKVRATKRMCLEMQDRVDETIIRVIETSGLIHRSDDTARSGYCLHERTRLD
jgi:hypothetical protein